MAKLTKLLRESIDQHKRKVYLKAAIDMATAYSRRGYTQDEAIKDAAKGIENVYGYVLTPQDIEAVRHFVPVNPQFKEAEDFDLSDNPVPTMLSKGEAMVISVDACRGIFFDGFYIESGTAKKVAENLYNGTLNQAEAWARQDAEDEGEDFDPTHYKEFINIRSIDRGCFIVGTGEESFFIIIDHSTLNPDAKELAQHVHRDKGGSNFSDLVNNLFI